MTERREKAKGFWRRFVPALVLLAASAAGAPAFEAVSIREYTVFPPDGTTPWPARPGRAALLPGGTLAVCDRDRVVLVGPASTRILPVNGPVAVAVGADALYVAEEERIRRFSFSGTELPALCDDEVAGFSAITGLAIDAAGNVLASDRGRDVVFVVSPDGTPLTVIGRDASAPARLSNPVDVAVDAAGNVYVADAGNERIAIFTNGGKYRGQIAPVEDPVAVTVDAGGLIYVADADGNRVRRFAFPNEPRGAFGTRGRERGQFRSVADIDVGGDGYLRVLDASNRTLHVLEWPSPPSAGAAAEPVLSARWRGIIPGGRVLGTSTDGRLLHADDDGALHLVDRDGASTPERVALREPFSAVADAQGRVYVADRSAGEVKVYDAAWTELFSFGRGSRIPFFRGGPGRLVIPRGLAISRKGLIAIVDRDKVELFGPDGTYMTSVGEAGDEPGQYEDPAGAAFDREGNLFIADAGNGRLLKFDSSGNFTGRAVNGLAPLSIASDEAGRVYLLDRSGPLVRVFSPELEPLMEIGTGRTGRGGLRGARALAVIGDRLHVSCRDGIAVLDLDLPPPAPFGVTVRGLARGLEVVWDTPAVSYAAGHLLLCGSRTAAAGAGARRAAVDGLADDTEAVVRVAALNAFGRSGPWSEPVSGRTSPLVIPVPSEPRVAFGPGLNDVRISWTCAPSPYVAGYAVEGGDGTRFERIRSTSETALVLPAGPWRRYRVRAVADVGREGEASPEAVHHAAEGFDALALGSNALAFEKMARAVEAEPANAAAWRALGEAGERLERFREAQAAYERCRALDARDSSARIGIARVALLRGESEAARAAIGDVGAPDDPDYNYVAGLIALGDEAWDTAVRLLARAVAVRPTGRNREALGRAEEARRVLGENRPRLEIEGLAMDPIFPALYKTYGTRPVGTAFVRNAGRVSLERVRVSVFIRGAMDFPSDTVLRRIDPGESVAVPVHVELSNEILGMTEDDTKQVDVRVTYYRGGEPVEVRRTGRVRVYARTALTWDDPARAAAFVTHRSPVVAEFARNVSGFADPASEAVNAPLRQVMLVRRALAAYGLRYGADPARPYARVSEEREAVDHVQLPEETLRNRYGDCDDLVVLCAALLENLGVRTMLGDLPGHVLFLVDSELPPEAAALVADSGAWIEHGGTAWIPIEATLIDASFADAVRAGARALEAGGARFVEVAAAWGAYPPVTTTPSEWRAPLPARELVLAGFAGDDRALRERMAGELGRADRAAAGSDAAACLRLGALCARLGLLDDAERWLRGAGESAAAFNNLGNVAMLRGEKEAARGFYGRALELAPADEGIRRNLERAQ